MFAQVYELTLVTVVVLVEFGITVTVAVPVPVPAIPPVIDEIEYVDVALGLTDILKGLVPVAV